MREYSVFKLLPLTPIRSSFGSIFRHFPKVTTFQLSSVEYSLCGVHAMDEHILPNIGSDVCVTNQAIVELIVSKGLETMNC